MAIGKFLFTIRIKAWRISKNGKLYYVFAQKIHIYSLLWLKLTLVLHTRMYVHSIAQDYSYVSWLCVVKL